MTNMNRDGPIGRLHLRLFAPVKASSPSTGVYCLSLHCCQNEYGIRQSSCMHPTMRAQTAGEAAYQFDRYQPKVNCVQAKSVLLRRAGVP